MNRWQRRALHRLANTLEDGSEWLVEWLRKRAERKERVRPLVFPSPAWLAMREVLDGMTRYYAAQVAKDIIENPLILYPDYDRQVYTTIVRPGFSKRFLAPTDFPITLDKDLR